MFCRLMLLCFTIVMVSARNSFPDQTDDTFQTQCLLISNNYRSKHHAPPFYIDNNAVAHAKSRCQLMSKWEGLSFLREFPEVHEGFGENIHWGGSTVPKLYDCHSAIDQWYHKEVEYDYNKQGFNSRTGDFTQLVWASTTGMGCARCGGLGSRSYETYIVCSYTPPGNVAFHFNDNVFRPEHI